jgi:hypothetical protein
LATNPTGAVVNIDDQAVTDTAARRWSASSTSGTRALSPLVLGIT